MYYIFCVTQYITRKMKEHGQNKLNKVAEKEHGRNKLHKVDENEHRQDKLHNVDEKEHKEPEKVITV